MLPLAAPKEEEGPSSTHLHHSEGQRGATGQAEELLGRGRSDAEVGRETLGLSDPSPGLREHPWG